jgi:hypothetical protein
VTGRCGPGARADCFVHFFGIIRNVASSRRARQYASCILLYPGPHAFVNFLTSCRHGVAHDGGAHHAASALEFSLLQGLQRGKCHTETKLHSRGPFTVAGCVQHGEHPLQSEVHAGCEGEYPGKEEEEEEQLEQPVPALL